MLQIYGDDEPLFKRERDVRETPTDVQVVQVVSAILAAQQDISGDGTWTDLTNVAVGLTLSATKNVTIFGNIDGHPGEPNKQKNGLEIGVKINATQKTGSQKAIKWEMNTATPNSVKETGSFRTYANPKTIYSESLAAGNYVIYLQARPFQDGVTTWRVKRASLIVLVTD